MLKTTIPVILKITSRGVDEYTFLVAALIELQIIMLASILGLWAQYIPVAIAP